MTRKARSETRRGFSGWKKSALRTIRVAYTASKFGLTMMAPAHALGAAVPCALDANTLPQAPQVATGERTGCGAA
jgi:hypothetical protein